MAEDLQLAQRRIQLDQIDTQISELEGKAVTKLDKIALLDLRMEQVGARLALAAQELAPPIEGKGVMAGMSRERERSLKRFIEDIGGFAPSGYAEDVLDFDEHHFERAMSLIRGEVEPESDAEVKALERWHAKHGT